MIRKQTARSWTSRPLNNTASVDPLQTPTVRQSATTQGSGPLENTVTAVPPPTSLRPPAPAGRIPLLHPPIRWVSANKGSGSPPRFVRAEKKARADKLQSLLYPHPEKLADFKSSVGGDLQPKRLLSDVKFRDTWKKLEGNPTGQLCVKLHKMGVTFPKRWYEKV